MIEVKYLDNGMEVTRRLWVKKREYTVVSYEMIEDEVREKRNKSGDKYSDWSGVTHLAFETRDEAERVKTALTNDLLTTKEQAVLLSSIPDPCV
ncbi:hypothetical protein [Entomobacter blattae]|uniref:Uncharacterized protein n=1 Tax=Entomobacter blattae TaxID=2762277 RepID=A0A7H1NU33_9PROT|nr:hypothetical protein [Entomobacter blattae]QNT79293.1 hypothetical protein JGUZn3_20900 [Entomobacter blattae]